jgi:hypothetical protein
VLNLDEMEAAGEDRAEGWFQMLCVIKAVGGRIIEFLHQIEEFQKMLWEKRKFITDTQYCVTVRNIAAEFYPDIAACDAQWVEWKELFHIDEEEADLFTVGKSKKDRRIAFLKAHPTLVLDTKHFDRDFVDRLVGSFNDLDEMTDGLLIHSENWQALNLLTEKYREKVKCIYIDPPYNTASSAIPYKNDYKHSSFASMMYDRVGGLWRTLTGDGALTSTLPAAEAPDRYVYDPADPVATRGGALCCPNELLPSGAFDQRSDDLFIDLVADAGLALERDHVLEARALGDRDGGKGHPGVLVTDVLDEQ